MLSHFKHPSTWEGWLGWSKCSGRPGGWSATDEIQSASFFQVGDEKAEKKFNCHLRLHSDWLERRLFWIAQRKDRRQWSQVTSWEISAARDEAVAGWPKVVELPSSEIYKTCLDKEVIQIWRQPCLERMSRGSFSLIYPMIPWVININGKSRHSPANNNVLKGPSTIPLFL